MHKKPTVKQLKQAAAIVKALKQDEAHLTRSEFFMRAEAVYWGENHGALRPVWQEVERQIGAWMDESRAEYAKLTADVGEVEIAERGRDPGAMRIYLTDESVDHENVTSRGGSEPAITEQSIGYWARMCGAAGPTIGMRAESYDLDINALLGRAIY